MPIAVVMEESEHYDLKTLPGGYVKIKRLTWGEKLQLRSFNSKMVMRAQKGKKDVESELTIFNRQQELYSMAHCITEHNLEDAIKQPDGTVVTRPLNLTLEGDCLKLRGDIAEEITTAIDKLNNFEDDEDTGK